MKAVMKPAGTAQRDKTVAVNSFWTKNGPPKDAHSAILAASKSAQHMALCQGWQPEKAQQIKAKEEAERCLKVREQCFLQALQDYQDNAKSKYKVNIALDLAAQHSWADVLKAVEDLSVACTDRKGFWAELRKKLHWFGEHSSVFQQWSSLLPTQSNYFSAMCGGLKLILTAAGRLKSVRDWVYRALQDLPTLLYATDRTIDAFDDMQLHICSRNLMGKTFDSLGWIVKELTRSATKKGAMALLKQETYAQDLRDCLDDVENLAEQFSRIADACAHAKLGNIDKMTAELREEVGLAHISTVAQIARVEKSGRASHRAMDKKLQTILDLVQSGFSASVEKRLPLIEKIPVAPTIVSKAKLELEQTRARSMVFACLQYDGVVLYDDLQHALDSVYTTSRRDQDRLHFLVTEQQLVDWLSTNSSALLLVEGCGSYLSAKLVQSVQAADDRGLKDDARRNICLFHFCAEHAREVADPFTGPKGLLQSLICQLLAANADIDAGELKYLLRYNGNPDVEQLWSCFEHLIHQLPPYTLVFCILDSITEYEAAWEPESAYIVQQLILLSQATQASSGSILKVLMTSSFTSRTLQHFLSPEQILEVPEDVPAVGDFSDRAWQGTRLSMAVEMDK